MNGPIQHPVIMLGKGLKYAMDLQAVVGGGNETPSSPPRPVKKTEVSDIPHALCVFGFLIFVWHAISQLTSQKIGSLVYAGVHLGLGLLDMLCSITSEQICCLNTFILYSLDVVSGVVFALFYWVPIVSLILICCVGCQSAFTTDSK